MTDYDFDEFEPDYESEFLENPEGYLYILTHPNDKDFVRIGKTKDVDKTLAFAQTLTPFGGFEIMYRTEWLPDAPAMLASVVAENSGQRVDWRDTWFRLPVTLSLLPANIIIKSAAAK